MFEQNEISKRFLKLFSILKEKKLFRSSSAFAKSIDYSPQAFHLIEKGKRDIPIVVLYNFFKVYKIDPSLVFVDREFEEKINGNKEAYAYEQYNVKIHPIVVDSNGDEKVMLVDKKAAAGYLQGCQSEEYIKELPTISLPPGMEHKSLCGFQIEGDSMEPNLFEGDWAYCSIVEKLSWVRLMQIYIIVCEEGIVAKRIVNVDLNRKLLTVRSDNSFYPDYTIPLQEVKQIWLLEKALKGKFPYQDKLEGRLEKLEKVVLKLID